MANNHKSLLFYTSLEMIQSFLFFKQQNASPILISPGFSSFSFHFISLDQSKVVDLTWDITGVVVGVVQLGFFFRHGWEQEDTSLEF